MSTPTLDYTCASCGEPATLRCVRCLGAFYCGKECQQKMWREHKVLCKAAGEVLAGKSMDQMDNFFPRFMDSQPSFVQILCVAPIGSVAYRDQDFTPVRADDVASIGLLKVRACTAFPHWHANAGLVAFFLVREGRERALAVEADPSLAAGILVGANKLATDDPVVAGSWLLARVPPPPPAHGLGANGAVDVVELLGAYVAEALSPAKAFAFRFHNAFAAERTALMCGAFNAREANSLRAKLRNVLSSSTRAQFVLSNGIVLDGPVGTSVGQTGTAVLFALRGARALCAKVGPRSIVRREWEAMVAVHGDGARVAPTVVRAEACEDIPSSEGLERAALLLLADRQPRVCS